ncbi:hypothetical protein AG1IA_10376 [Rhizoctonia solani AG-1 IA]|uniref:Uncharacterized protein n=1 Tax=Thanatephorus cucumeris (strain AG1-IA) TaxID=983506 RepID=L8WGS3_THACA|nr:hypothetical protein AG1IA_10376 [Rhizoctonia solani AG-1 IA]
MVAVTGAASPLEQATQITHRSAQQTAVHPSLVSQAQCRTASHPQRQIPSSDRLIGRFARDVVETKNHKRYIVSSRTHMHTRDKTLKRTRTSSQHTWHNGHNYRQRPSQATHLFRCVVK